MTERNIPADAPEAEEQVQIDGEARLAPARPRDKVVAAVTAVSEVGKLKSWHSDSEVRKIAETWLKEQECTLMPGDGTWKRELPRLRHLWRSGC
jgi:hypothetical protein